MLSLKDIKIIDFRKTRSYGPCTICGLSWASVTTHKTCTKYQTQCHTCPLLYKGSKHDLSYQVFLKKQKLYKKSQYNVRCLQPMARRTCQT